MTDSTETEATVQRFVACINAHDVRRIVALCSERHVFIDSLGSELSGLEQLERGWTFYFSLFPDYRIEIQSLLSRADLVLACGFASATHAPTRSAWRIPAAWRAAVEGDRILRWQVYADNKPVYELLAPG